MNPNAPQPSFELPPLPGESGGDYAPAPEVGPSKQPIPHPAQQPLAQAPAQPVPIAPVQAPVQAQGSQPATSGITADDNDLIEKEWVLKAKQIVAATKDDPHTQNKELGKMKAEYLKKRYGKEIKVEGS